MRLAGAEDVAADQDDDRVAALDRFARDYEAAKTSVLDAAVTRVVSVLDASAALDALSDTRRLVEQLVKADRLLRTPGQAQAIEAQANERAVSERDHSDGGDRQVITT